MATSTSRTNYGHYGRLHKLNTRVELREYIEWTPFIPKEVSRPRWTRKWDGWKVRGHRLVYQGNSSKRKTDCLGYFAAAKAVNTCSNFEKVLESTLINAVYIS